MAQELEPHLKEILLNLLREQYPGIAQYQNGELLAIPEPPPEVLVPETELDYIVRDSANSLVVDVNNEAAKHVKYTLVSREPNLSNLSTDPNTGESLVGITPSAFADMIDYTFQYFVEEDIPPPEVEEPEIINDLFMARGDINLQDVHDSYITNGPSPQNLLNIETVFSVYLIENNIARPIPNYKTLEVMLVEKGQSYTDIVETTSDDVINYDLNFSATGTPIGQFDLRKMPDRSQEWTELIRFNSGYRPIAPFVRDPGEYIDLESESGYQPIVFTTQTERETLRAKYEGKAIVLNATFQGNNEAIDEGINPNDITEVNLGAVRIMIHGYWKFVQVETTDGIDVLKYYNQFNDFGATLHPNDIVKIIDGLNKVNGITLLQDSGQASPVWNDFGHIAGINVLDPAEYKEYWNNSNAGNYFDIEYMVPYEPPGSIKYYTAAISSGMKAQQQQYFQGTLDDYDEQQAFDAACFQMTEDLNNLVSQYEMRLIELESGMNGPAQELTNAITILKDDLQKIFVTPNTIFVYDRWSIRYKGSVNRANRNLFDLLNPIAGPAYIEYHEDAFEGINNFINSNINYNLGPTDANGNAQVPHGYGSGNWTGNNFFYNTYSNTWDINADSIVASLDEINIEMENPDMGTYGSGFLETQYGGSGAVTEGSNGGDEFDRFVRSMVSLFNSGPWGYYDHVEMSPYIGAADVDLRISNQVAGDEWTPFDAEARQIYNDTIIDIPDLQEKIADLIVDIADLKDRVRFNWNEIPNRQSIWTQEDLTNYIAELEYYQDRFNRYNQVVPGIDVLAVIQNFQTKWMTSAYQLIESMRESVFTNSEGNKTWIRWPNQIASLINNYIPYGPDEDYNTRFNNFRWTSAIEG